MANNIYLSMQELTILCRNVVSGFTELLGFEFLWSVRFWRKKLCEFFYK